VPGKHIPVMMMRLCGILAALGIMAGSTVGANAQPSIDKAKVTVFYMCNGLHLKTIYDNHKDRVSFVWGAKDYHLTKTGTHADGVHYAAASGLEWIASGPNATLKTLPEHTVLTTCTPGKRF